ncbi:MAG: hypothetical protein R3A52_11685 [Polyangiales bacterium]
MRARPVWRSYDPRWVANAAAHARAGGHALVREAPRWWVLLPSGDDGSIPELTAWALMDARLGALSTVTSGPAAGMLRVTVPVGARSLVEGWCERDAGVATSTSPVDFDCRACAMCCRRNRALVDDDDIEAWRAVGRAELATEAYLRTVRGRRALRVLRGGDCVHLRGERLRDLRAAARELRGLPDGQRGCLSSREEAGLDLALPVIAP